MLTTKALSTCLEITIPNGVDLSLCALKIIVSFARMVVVCCCLFSFLFFYFFNFKSIPSITHSLKLQLVYKSFKTQQKSVYFIVVCSHATITITSNFDAPPTYHNDAMSRKTCFLIWPCK